MSADQEYSGDYGYDLAHEVRTVGDEPSVRRGTAPEAGVSVAPFVVDPHSDFGYDSAHEG